MLSEADAKWGRKAQRLSISRRPLVAVHMRSFKSDVEEEEEEQARLANSGCGRPPQMMRISLIDQLGL